MIITSKTFSQFEMLTGLTKISNDIKALEKNKSLISHIYINAVGYLKTIIELTNEIKINAQNILDIRSAL